MSLRRGPAAVWALNVALAVAAAGGVLRLGGQGAWHPGVAVPWWALAAGFALTEACVVHVHFRRSAHTFTLGELPLVIGVLFTPPAYVPLAFALGVAVVMAHQRPPLVRALFNVAQLAASATIAVTLFRALVPAAGALGPAVWVAAVAAVASSAAVCSLLVITAMAVSGEDVALSEARGLAGASVVVSVVNCALGLAAAMVLAVDPRGAALLLAPAAVIFVAYRAYSSERAKHTELEFLYSASDGLTRVSNVAAGLVSVLTQTAKAFRAEYAEAYVFGTGDGDASWRATVAADGRIRRRPDVGDEVAEALRALVEAEPGARAVRGDELDGALGEHLRGSGLHDGILVALRGDGGVAGALVIANREGAGGRGFGAGDVRLCGTLAGHLGSWLGQNRLQRQVSELEETQRELYHQAFHDPLTGLANRLLFTDRVRHALTRRDGSAAVVYVDLDDFKPVNDTLGHDAGDALLCAVADRLRDSLRAADTPARLGGDEFAVLLMDVNLDEARIVAERILRAFAKPVPLANGHQHSISASLGVAVGVCGAIDGDRLISNADTAMYVSKHGGKRGVSLYEETGEELRAAA